MDVSGVTFVDIEATRSGRVLAIGAVRGPQRLHVRADAEGIATLAQLCGDGVIAGHNLSAHDLPLLSALPAPFSVPRERVLDTWILSLLADPSRASHALDKSDANARAGAVPDPIADAERARELAMQCLTQLRALSPPEAALYGALLLRAGHAALAEALGVELPTLPAPVDAAAALSTELLGQLCRVQLLHLLQADAFGAPDEYLALALVVRFVQVSGRDGRLSGPPAAALCHLPRFTELLTRVLGPLCPDLLCPHRDSCAVHRPFAEELLHSHFELDAFRPHQREIVMAVLQNRAPLAVLPTGGGKSLCYQLPAIHGAERLRGLTVVISPLQALMADQVRGLSRRFPPTCLLNASLLMEERRQNMAGLRSGRYHIVYMGPEQLRNPSVLRLLQNRPPLLWVIDEAHCVSQWGHSFRTDYTYLPRAIAAVHGAARRPLLALFTATASADVRDDIEAQFRSGLGASLTRMEHGGRRENLAYEVVAVADRQSKDNQLLNLLGALPDGSRLLYCATVRSARELQALLRESGIPAALYHGQLPPNEKAEQLERFLSGQSRTVVATSAFGMGIDKPDIRLVVHYEPSGSLEDYVQETGRAGRDGQPARCILLYDESDLETQFFLKTSTRVTAREVKRIWFALRRRARRLSRTRDDEGFVELWVSPEDLFVEEQLERELDWSRDALQTKLKLVLYHLEADGVCVRLENRTRPYGLYPLCPLAEALLQLPSPHSPATLRVLHYLHDERRPRQVSILDLGEECGLRPAEAFREVQTLTRLELIGQELSFEVTLARGVPHATPTLIARAFDCALALLALVEDPDPPCLIHLRSAAAGVTRALGSAVAPHEVWEVLRALRTQGLLRMDRFGAGRYRVEFEPNFVAALDRLRELQRVAQAVWSYIDARCSGRRGRDLGFELDVNRFLGEERRLTERFSAEQVVDACLLMHHFEALHLSDPPVLLQSAMRIKVRADATALALDLGRPRRYHEHQMQLVHLMREYAILNPKRRERFVEHYFTLPRKDLVRRYLRGRLAEATRPVSPKTEAELLAGLTEAQRSAVTAEERAVLVVAGPGSGKTHTVVRRVCHMVRARQIRPDSILILAFNRSAASELRRRLLQQLGPRARAVDVRTFHSLALKLTGAEVLGDRADAEQRLSQIVTEAAKLLEGDAEHEGEAGAVVRERVVGHVRHVLVDEYQDLDPDQYRLLAALVGLDRGAAGEAERTERSVYVVGDDDQAIYGFRNASVEFLRRFEGEFGARRIFLCDNFRSCVPIVDAAFAFIAHNPERLKGPAEAMRAAPGAAPGDTDSVRRFRYLDLEQVAAHAFYSVQRSLEQHGGSIAVLARNWADLDSLRAHLEAAGVPFVFHHRDHHRPVHRRHPAERLLRELLRADQVLHGSGVAWLEAQSQALGRDLGEPSIVALRAFAHESDEERLGERQGEFTPIASRELWDTLLCASRDAALSLATAAEGARVHLASFHGAKGLEFDKVIVYPSAPPSAGQEAEERRLYYVALTRARSQLIACTLGRPGELALELALVAGEHDLRRQVQRLALPAAAFLDCTPADVQLAGRLLGPAQAAISALREGDALQLVRAEGRMQLQRDGVVVGLLSKRGEERLARLQQRHRGTPCPRVHEVYVHLTRGDDGGIRRRDLVVVPSFRLQV